MGKMAKKSEKQEKNGEVAKRYKVIHHIPFLSCFLFSLFFSFLDAKLAKYIFEKKTMMMTTTTLAALVRKQHTPFFFFISIPFALFQEFCPK